MANTDATDAAAAPDGAPAAADAAPAAGAPSTRQCKKLVTAVSQRDYVAVMKAVRNGISPNVNWKSLLPMRTAVLIGDVDMVALLSTVGGDPDQVPKGMTEPTLVDEAPREIVLGKSARALATDMAKDMSNPLRVDASQMLIMMEDAEAARDRVRELQKKVEAQMKDEVRQASYMLAVFLVLFLASFAAMHYLGWDEDGGDAKEL